jgi:hypothetical protein
MVDLRLLSAGRTVRLVRLCSCMTVQQCTYQYSNDGTVNLLDLLNRPGAADVCTSAAVHD